MWIEVMPETDRSTGGKFEAPLVKQLAEWICCPHIPLLPLASLPRELLGEFFVGFFSPVSTAVAMSMMRSVLVLCAVLSASAFHAAPVHRAPLSSRRSVRAAPAMSAPLDFATQLAATPISGAELPLPSVLVAEGVFDLIEGFASSPLVLLIPIGAGGLVAFGVIFVLVKSAEPDKQS